MVEHGLGRRQRWHADPQPRRPGLEWARLALFGADATSSRTPEEFRGRLPVDELRKITDRRELASSHPNDRAHYAHRRNLADAAVDGVAVRSMCGVYFVQTQDWETLERCEICEDRWSSLP